MLHDSAGFIPSQVYSLMHTLAMAASVLVRGRAGVQASFIFFDCTHSLAASTLVGSSMGAGGAGAGAWCGRGI